MENTIKSKNKFKVTVKDPSKYALDISSVININNTPIEIIDQIHKKVPGFTLD